jgi:serine/threonine-protein kinase
LRSCFACHRQFVDTQEACPLDGVRLAAPVDKVLPAGVGRVLGSYRLICLLGEGGMGNIYIGAHTRLNRFVAIKVLRPELQHRGDAIARFFEEARTVNRLKHPNIVESIDLVEDVVDGAYCVLELLHGPALKTRLANGRLPLESAVRIGAQIADALHAVHALDIVHRDLKPDNLILIPRGGRDDFVKLIDFGVAQISQEEASGMPFGTAAYMAPEQAAGERVDGRADVYSLGVLLFEMVTGIHPFPSTNDNEYVLRHADDTAPRPSKIAHDAGVPKELDAVILRCLEKQPQDRFPSAAALAVALRAIELEPRRRRTGLFVTLGMLAGAGIGAALIVPDLLAKDASATTATAPPPTTMPAPAPVPTEEPVAAPPPPAAPATVTLGFTSTPPGARVFRQGETVPLGVTPFTTELARAERSTPVRFELEGYEPIEVDASLATSENLSVTLEQLPAAPAAARAIASKKRAPAPAPRPNRKSRTNPTVQREGVMNPFADPFATKN